MSTETVVTDANGIEWGVEFTHDDVIVQCKSRAEAEALIADCPARVANGEPEWRDPRLVSRELTEWATS